MGFKRSVEAAASLLLLAASAQAAVEGKVTLSGTPAELAHPVRFTAADPTCPHGASLTQENWKIAPGGGLADTIITVQNAPASKPDAKALVDQKGCRYEPHVLCIVQGTTVTFKNSDQTLHNVHGMQYMGANENSVDLFNLGQIGGMSTDQIFDTSGIFKIKCDVHPWMLGWIFVTQSRFFAVTGADGAFRLPAGLPDGAYHAQAWHSGFEKPLLQDFTVKGGNATVNFEFNAAQAN